MMRRIAILISLLWLAGLSVPASAGDDRLVLVTATPALAESGVTLETTRKTFLGRRIAVDGHRVVPLINKSDPLLYQVFLQKVVYMSSSHYERHLLSRVYRVGGKRPPNFNSERTLLRSLRTQPFSVSYMWKTNAQSSPDVYIIRDLWIGQAD